MQRKDATPPENAPVSKIKRADHLISKELTKRVVVAKDCEGANISTSAPMPRTSRCLRCSAYCSSAVVSSAADLQPRMAFQRHQYGRIDRAAWLSPPLRVRRSAFAASCSALEKSSSLCSTWLLIDLVVLFNKDRPPMPRLQRLAEHSEDSCQLNSRCGV